VKFPAIALVSMAVMSCAGPVRQRVPQPGLLPESLKSNPAIVELIHKELGWGLDAAVLAAPDGYKKLKFVGENASGSLAKLIFGGESPNFFGLELQESERSIPRPIMSLWECDTGCSCASLQVGWATDSTAVRLKGCTRGFRRHGSIFSEFDLLYVLDLAKFYELRATTPNTTVLGSLSSFGLNPTALASRRLPGKRRANAPRN